MVPCDLLKVQIRQGYKKPGAGPLNEDSSYINQE